VTERKNREEFDEQLMVYQRQKEEERKKNETLENAVVFKTKQEKKERRKNQTKQVVFKNFSN